MSGARDSYQLVLTRKAKVLTCWRGKPGGEKADVGLDMLIPASLRKTQEIDNLPWAIPQESVTLGGELRLTATSAAEQQSQWKTLLVWGR